MTDNSQPQRKNYVMYSLSLVLLAAGCAAFIWGFHKPLVRAVGIVAAMGAVKLAQLSRVNRRALSENTKKGIANYAVWKPTRIDWALGMASLVFVAYETFALYWAVLHKSNDPSPAYWFTGSALVAILIWAYLNVKRNNYKALKAKFESSEDD
jgi:hypothetical protein